MHEVVGGLHYAGEQPAANVLRESMSLQERIESIRSAPVPRNEEETKFKILTPILQELGWDPFGSDVLYEHPVGGKGGGGRADIALRSPRRVVALVEVKAPGKDLASHVDQMIGYAFHEGVDICLLTTGLEWWLYLPREPGGPSQRRFAVLSVKDDPLEQLVEDFDAFLSKEALISRRAERQAKKDLKALHEAAELDKQIPLIWNGMVDEPDDDLVELLIRRVYREISLRPTKEQVIAALGGAPVPSARSTASPPNDTVAPASLDTEKPTEKPARRPSRKPRAIELCGEYHPVTSHKDVLKIVVDVLFERHRGEFHRILELRGRKLPYATDDVREVEAFRADAFYKHEESGYFINSHLSATDVERRVRLFLEHFGYGGEDLNILYD